MNVGLYFGSFNPIHIGHLIIANHVLHHANLDQVWFVVSPHNPLKESASLLRDQDRLHLVQLAVECEPRFRASSVEFALPRPSYTIDTMTHLSEKYPQHQFRIILGGDSYQNIRKWKNYERLLQDYSLLVYRRPGFDIDTGWGVHVEALDAPLLDISSTFIRGLIRAKKSIRFLVPDVVREEIERQRYYL
ncbi:MAG: nicotinate-nucleotide adenylyltransferase [Chitinophagaceae bacterium]|nr:nicotinate-nucleotide adenylyltransferase [Chitinophagaceae bacterium]